MFLIFFHWNTLTHSFEPIKPKRYTHKAIKEPITQKIGLSILHFSSTTIKFLQLFAFYPFHFVLRTKCLQMAAYRTWLDCVICCVQSNSIMSNQPDLQARTLSQLMLCVSVLYLLFDQKLNVDADDEKIGEYDDCVFKCEGDFCLVCTLVTWICSATFILSILLVMGFGCLPWTSECFFPHIFWNVEIDSKLLFLSPFGDTIVWGQNCSFTNKSNVNLFKVDWKICFNPFSHCKVFSLFPIRMCECAKLFELLIFRWKPFVMKMLIQSIEKIMESWSFSFFDKWSVSANESIDLNAHLQSEHVSKVIEHPKIGFFHAGKWCTQAFRRQFIRFPLPK